MIVRIPVTKEDHESVPWALDDAGETVVCWSGLERVSGDTDLPNKLILVFSTDQPDDDDYVEAYADEMESISEVMVDLASELGEDSGDETFYFWIED